MDNNEKITMAIWIANEMKDVNYEKAEVIVKQIIEDANITQYNDIDTSVIISVYVRKWNDILSSSVASEITSSLWYTEYDLYKSKLINDDMIGQALDNLMNWNDDE